MGAIISVEPYNLHDDITNINGYEVIFYNNSHWLKIFHHNTRVCHFNDDNANYSTNKHCFSILSKINQNFRVSNGTENVYSLMLELPQIPQHIRWHQFSYFSDTVNSTIGYEQHPDTSGNWTDFNGIHGVDPAFSSYTLYACSNFSCISAIGYKREGHVLFLPRSVQFIDVWIELRSLSLMNLLNPISPICTEKVTYKRVPPSHFLFIVIGAIR